MAKKRKILFYIGVALLLVVIAVLVIIGLVKFNHWRILESNKLLSESQKTADAKKSFVLLQKATLLNPGEDTNLLAGEKAQEAGYGQLATHYFKKINTAEGYDKLGNIFYQNGQYKSAKKAYQNSLNKKVGQKASVGLGKIYLKEGDIARAREEFAKILALTKNNHEVVYYLDLTKLFLSNEVMIDLNPLNQQKDKLDKITQIPAKTTRINMLYQYLLKNGYPQLAFNFLKSKGDGSQLDRDGYLLLANEYYTRHDYRKSNQYLLSAKDLDQYYPHTYQHLVEVAELLGNKDEANQYREFLKQITW